MRPGYEAAQTPPSSNTEEFGVTSLNPWACVNYSITCSPSTLAQKSAPLGFHWSLQLLELTQGFGLVTPSPGMRWWGLGCRHKTNYQSVVTTKEIVNLATYSPKILYFSSIPIFLSLAIIQLW